MFLQSFGTSTAQANGTKSKMIIKLLKRVVAEEGLEPPTHGL